MPPRRVLIISLRRLGDVLLSTPLAASIRAAWPETRIDWLVYSDCAGPLENNPVADGVIPIDPSISLRDSSLLAIACFQRYDIAISTQSGDRPSLLARFLGRRAITFRSQARGANIRDIFFSDTVDPPKDHKVRQLLSLLAPLGIKKIELVCPPRADLSVAKKLQTPYAIFHPGAAFRYKRWTSEGWRFLVEKFTEHSLKIVVTGGSHSKEKAYLDSLFINLDVIRVDGTLSWPQLVGLLERASCYVGIDTSVTHLAAACQVPGVAIYGPADPKLWGPYSGSGGNSLQVMSQILPCTPCQQEGCDRHLESHSLCLDTFEPEIIWKNIVSRGLIA